MDSEESDDVYNASISELMRLFRQSLLTALPLAMEAKWFPDSDEPHYLWRSHITHCFDSFVRQPIEVGIEWPPGPAHLEPFGARQAKLQSWLTPTPEQPRNALIDVGQGAATVDQIQVAHVGLLGSLSYGTTTLPWTDDTPFAFVVRGAHGYEVFTEVSAHD